MKLTRVFKQNGPAEGSKDVQMIFDGGDAIAIYHIYRRCWYACIDVVDCKRGISKIEFLKTVAEAIHKQEPELLCMNYLVPLKEGKKLAEAGWMCESIPCYIKKDTEAVCTFNLPTTFRDKDGNELHIGDKVLFNDCDKGWFEGEVTNIYKHNGSIRITYEYTPGKTTWRDVAYDPKGNLRIQLKK